MNTQEMSTRFYRRLRKLNDKKKVRKRELLGLYFDLYELFMAMSEEARTEALMETIMPPPGMMKMFKIPGKGEEEKDAEEEKPIRPKPGAYL